MAGTHARLSPSGADRWMQCLGSVALSEGLPDASSTYANEGTAAHFLASESLAGGHHPSHYMGQTIYVYSDGATWAVSDIRQADCFPVDLDMVGHVNHYVQAVNHYAEGGTALYEQSIPIGNFTGEEGATGTADAVIITPDGELQIHDLKYGQGKVVSAENNRQLMLYALGAVETYGVAYDFDHVRLVIHQPRVFSAPSEWSCGLDTLAIFAKNVEFAADMVRSAPTQGPETFLAASEEACRWCKAKVHQVCPAIDAFVAETVGADFDDLDAETVIGGVEALSTKELAQKMAACDLIEGWIKAVRGKVESELFAGVPVPGYKIVQGKRGHRKWADATEAEGVLKTMRLKVEEMYDMKVISPTQVEKIFGPKGSAPSVKRWNKLQAFITQSEGAPSVAPASDPRPPLEIKPVIDEFSNLDEEDLV